MPLLTVHNVSLAYGHHPLLDHASCQLDRGERVCVIGRNGTGKSTLLKLITGSIQPDEGELRRDSGVRVAYLPQEPELDEAGTVYENVAAGLGELRQVILDYHHVIQALNAPDADVEALLERMHHLQEALERRHGWEVAQRIEQTLTLLQLPTDAQVSQLSGGWKRRVALGRALVIAPDILLLDEPTNHLDIEAIQWLEDTLMNFRGALLFVTHDRHFLDRLATRILELDRGHLTGYEGNFSQYQRRKAEQLSAEATQNALFDKRLAEEERWIRKGIQARRTRNEGRVRALKALRVERSDRRNLQGKAKLALDSGEQSGKLVLEATGVSFAYDGKPVVRDLDLRVLRGDRIGLIGPNGVGKTTLLKLLLKQIEPNQGSVRHGTNLQIAYFDQTRAQLDPEARVVDCVGGGKEFVTIAGKSRHAMSYLADFLFPPERARSPVKSLSGGERARLLLAQLFAQPANVLVMDEPTNDLDIETLELLEELLAEYDGTVFMVSHDRTFLDNVVTSSLVFSGNGMVKEFFGGYSDWLRQCSGAPAPTAAGKPSTDTKSKSAPASKPKASQHKPSFKEQRELEELPRRIEGLEKERDQLHTRLADPKSYENKPAALADISTRLSAIEAELAQAYARWEALEADGG